MLIELAMSILRSQFFINKLTVKQYGGENCNERNKKEGTVAQRKIKNNLLNSKGKRIFKNFEHFHLKLFHKLSVVLLVS